MSASARGLLPDSLVVVVHAFTASCTADCSPLGHQLQQSYQLFETYASQNQVSA